MPMRSALSFGDGPGIDGAMMLSNESIRTLIGSSVIAGKAIAGVDLQLASLIGTLVDDESCFVVGELALDGGGALGPGGRNRIVTIDSSVVSIVLRAVVLSAADRWIVLACDFCDLPRRT